MEHGWFEELKLTAAGKQKGAGPLYQMTLNVEVSSEPEFPGACHTH